MATLGNFQVTLEYDATVKAVQEIADECRASLYGNASKSAALFSIEAVARKLLETLSLEHCKELGRQMGAKQEEAILNAWEASVPCREASASISVKPVTCDVCHGSATRYTQEVYDVSSGLQRSTINGLKTGYCDAHAPADAKAIETPSGYLKALAGLKDATFTLDEEKTQQINPQCTCRSILHGHEAGCPYAEGK